MAECIVLKGGGGADLDVITATAQEVLAGKVTVDKAGEPVIGTMPNRGSSVHGAGTGLNQQGLYYYIPKGYYDEGSLTPWVYMTRPEVATALGIEAWKMRADQNICGVQGSIPLQNPEIANTDHMWATNYSNFGDGNYFLGIRNGYYNNGVNWVRGYNANFVAANIKKGVNVAGIVGTWEGYVASPTDWYYFGSNPAGFYSQNSSIVFESNQIKARLSSGGGASYLTFSATNAYNLTGYSYLGIVVSSSGAYGVSISLTVSGFSGTIGPFTGSTTIYIPLINANVTGVPSITVSHNGAGVTTTYITRMWLT